MRKYCFNVVKGVLCDNFIVKIILLSTLLIVLLTIKQTNKQKIRFHYVFFRHVRMRSALTKQLTHAHRRHGANKLFSDFE